MPNSRKNRVKLSDIAQASGVSLTAVSLALSDKPGISKETRVRVLEMARSLGYHFKSPASSAQIKPIKTIGLLVKSSPGDEPRANYFYSHIIAGIEGTCRQMGINLMFANLPVNQDNFPLELPPLLEKSDVEGLLLAGAFVDDHLSQILDRRSCPLVLIDSYSSTREYNAVLSDNVLGAYQATQFLIHKGHRHIGFVGGHPGAFPSFRDRRTGYWQALTDCNMGHPTFADCLFNRAELATAVLELVTQNRQISGLVCVNDDTAISTMYSLIEAGIRVPQDISIIGFDDIYLAENVVPALTTMRVNKQSMGRLAVQILLNQMYQMDGGCVTSIYRPSLVERNSVMEICRSEAVEEITPSGN